jgi:hypothetical protein
VITNEYLETQIKLDQKYWESLGNTTKVSNSLTVSKGISTVGGLGKGCSIQNYSNKGVSTSTLIVQINNQPFYKVIESDYGMNQVYNIERYVQMLDTTQCRFIEFSNHWGNPGAYYSDKEEVSTMNKNNEIFKNMLKQKQQEIFDSIKVGNPTY